MIVVACYRAMQRVTVTNGLELYVNHDCVFANASLHCYSAFELWELSDFLPLFTAVHRPLDERQCLVQGKQGVYAIKSHDI